MRGRFEKCRRYLAISVGVLGLVGIRSDSAAEGELRYGAFRVPHEILYHFREDGAAALHPALPLFEKSKQTSLPQADEAEKKATGAWDLLDLKPLFDSAGLRLEPETFVGFSPNHALIFTRGTREEISLIRSIYWREGEGWSESN